MPGRDAVRGLRARHIIDAVEAAYALDGADEDWLRRLLDATHADVDHGAGTYVFAASTASGRMVPASGFVMRELDPRFLAALAELNETAPDEVMDYLADRVVSCGGIEALLGTDHAVIAHFRARTVPVGIHDFFSLVARDGEDGALVLSAPSATAVRPHARVAALWRRAAMHMAAGLRLRRRVARGAGCTEALLATDGRVVHAEGAARTSTSARAALQAAVRAVERARASDGRADPERAMEVWRGLVAGRWSLVDQWESDGRRYVAAHENRPELCDPRALTALERAVVRYVSLGASDKEIAFALGLALGTVATAVRQAARKLGCRARGALAAFGTGTHARVRVGDAALDVLATGLDPAHPALARLTATERDVAARIVAGDTNAAIAKRRRTSVKTVANQVASVYGKLGVQSRRELVRRLARGAS